MLGGFTDNGGIGRVTSILANSLCKDQEYAIYALSFFDTHKQDLYHMEPEIIRNHLFADPLNMRKAILTGGIKRLKAYLNENDIDILIACGALYYPISILACRGGKTRCICWEHSNVSNAKDHSFQLLCRRFGAKNADIVVTLTKHDQKSFTGEYGIGNVAQIYNPIDEEAIRHVKDYNESSKKILSVGRLSYQKNFELLVEIAKEILPRNPGWSWDIYGQGDLKDLLQERIVSYGLESRLTLKGQVGNLYELYNDYSMLVMTSRYEGFPMTLLEGMAFGLPLISFDILTGPNEIIRDGENGYLIDPFSKEAMIACVNKLISDSALRANMSKYGKNDCGRFRLDAIEKEWKMIFNELLRSNGGN